jgi:hypothetical protein
MARVFICYSCKDREFARRLTLDLDRLGADVWIDVDDIRSGEDWSDAIQQALDGCLVMVLILSPEAMASTNVANEWKYFLETRRPIIPVLLQPARIHFRLKPLQYLDFYRQSYAEAFHTLHDALLCQGIPLATLPGREVTVPAVTRLSPPTVQPSRPVRSSHPARRALSVLAVMVTLIAALLGIGITALSWVSALSDASGSNPPTTPRGSLGIVGVSHTTLSPTPPEFAAPELRLVYDRYEFLLINASGRALDVSRLVFEQILPDGTARRFESAAWKRSGVVMLPAGECYQLLTAEARQVAPSRADCPQRAGFFSTGLVQRHFWIAATPGAQFTVLIDGNSVASCTIETGECAFSLPE